MLTGILDQVFHFSRCPASSNITSGFALCAKEQPFGSKANAEYAFEAERSFPPREQASARFGLGFAVEILTN